MPDLWHDYGADLALGATGDLALADGTAFGEQRVLRRLLTNPGDYIWQPAYGAGLGQFVGLPGAPAAIAGTARAEMSAEPIVARSPAPVVSVSASDGGAVSLAISYVDLPSGATTQITTTVS